MKTNEVELTLNLELDEESIAILKDISETAAKLTALFTRLNDMAQIKTQVVS